MSHREYQRSDRVSSALRKELAVFVHQAVRDHALPSVSVSDAEVNKDLSQAVIYITALLPDQHSAALKWLNANAWQFRQRLSKIMKTRIVPELKFAYDPSLDEGEKISQLLNQVKPSDA